MGKRRRDASDASDAKDAAGLFGLVASLSFAVAADVGRRFIDAGASRMASASVRRRQRRHVGLADFDATLRDYFRSRGFRDWSLDAFD